MRVMASFCVGISLLLLTVAWGRSSEVQSEKEPHYGGSIAFSPDGKLFADGYRLWNLTTGRVVRKLNGDDVCGAIAFSPDGKLIAGSTGRAAFFLRLVNEIRIWDVVSGKRRKTLRDERTAFVAFSPDSKLVANPGREGVNLTSVATGKAVFRLPAGTWPDAKAVAFSADGEMMASGGWHGIRLWNWTNGLALRSIPTEPLLVDCLAWSRDGRLLAAGGTLRNEDYRKKRGEVRLIGAGNPDRFRPLAASYKSLHAAAFSPDGRLVAAAEGGWTGPSGVDLWEVSSGKRLRTLPGPAPTRAGDYTAVWSVAFSPDGKLLGAGMTDGAAPKFWNVSTGEEVQILGPQETH